ncbi:MAG: EAL domain-containing protein [Proteobacteria bacterium]|nr:EAL domain-containing protein [Pseudomonadota bacterium]
MPNFRDLPIRQKLMQISVLASGVALLLASAGFLTYEFVAYRETTLNRLSMVANVTAANSVAALVFQDRTSAEATLQALRAEHTIVSACLYTATGERFASYRREGEEEHCPDRDPGGDGFSLAGSNLLFAFPIESTRGKAGAILIRAEPIELWARLTRYGGIIGGVTLVSMLVAFGIVSRLQRFISLPILRLVETARHVTFARDYAIRAHSDSRDELGLLITSFNEMLEQIQTRDRELKKHRDHLDEEVQSRTAELSSVVDELRSEIAQREQAEERIRYLAYYDVLTGLPNRQFLKERLDQALAEAAREDGRVALLFLDLDRFKEINDSFGHSTGDELLRHVAERLMQCVRSSDTIVRKEEAESNPCHTVSRQGGDEFTILLTQIQSVYDASRVASRVLAALRDPFHLDDREMVIGTSIGIAVYPDDGRDGDTLLKHADTAMYHAKEAGRNDYEYFSTSMKVEALRKVTIESDLRRALDLEEFALCYQPKVRLSDGCEDGLEALLRWNHPDGQRLPNEFIPVAEDSGLVVPLGDWVLQAACQQAREWERADVPFSRVAVNVSGRQFRKGALLQSVTRILHETGLAPERLELEVTEHTMVQNEQDAIRTLRRLRQRGVRVSLDDFGTGYSSLSYVRRFPLDWIKIDSSFVGDLEENTGIVTAVIAMAHNLGLQVVAEGVETTEQYEFLRAQGCDAVQGYLVAKPLPAEEVASFLEGHFGPDATQRKSLKAR